MKTYLKTIKYTQDLFLGISILIMIILPIILAFFPEIISPEKTLSLYDLSHIAVFFVMIIRPLSDIFTQTNLIRPLVILRKGVGVFSASIIVSFIFSKIIIDPVAYFSAFKTFKYWSIDNFALLAHLADISALILIITSNNFSKRILGTYNWKNIQRLSYLYFYASSLYVLLVLEDVRMLFSIIIVTLLTIMAYIKNKNKKLNKTINTNNTTINNMSTI